MTIENNENGRNLIACLIDLGMSEREAKVYLALLKKRHGTAAELQKLSGVPQSKIYETIGSLVHYGYCSERKIGHKRSFEAIDPKVTLAPSFSKLQKRLENSFGHMEKVCELYIKSKETAEPLEYIEVLRGKENVHHQYCRLVSGVKNELLGFGRKPYACNTPEKSAEQDCLSSRISARGGSVRWVFELELPDDEWIVDDLNKLQKIGQQIKVADKLPLKMMIFDRELLLVAEEAPFGPLGELTMSIVRQGTVVNAFCVLFEFFWKQATEFDKWQESIMIGLNS